MVGLVGGTTLRNAAADCTAAPLKYEGFVVKRLTACAFLLIFFALVFAPVKFAWAEDLDMYPVADEFQQEVERTADEYESAREKLAQAEADIQENTVRIDELSAEIPQQQQRGAEAARELYKFQQQGAGLLQMLLESSDFYGFLVNLEYLNRISDSHGQELQKLVDLQDELETRQVALEKAHSNAAKQAKKAEEALKAAQEARLEAQQRAQEEARRQAEEAAAAAAAEAAAQAAAEAEAAEAARELYKFQQQGAGLLQMLLESSDFYGFLVNLEYLNRISDSHGQELQKLVDLQDELETRQVALEKAHSNAAKQAKKAEEALKAAQEARLEAQQRAQEEARRQAEEAAAAAAAEAAAQAAAEAEAAEAAGSAQDVPDEKEAVQSEEAAKQNESDNPEEEPVSEAADKPNQGASEEAPAPAEEEQPDPVLEQPTDDGADWTSDQAAFINEWSARIDGYLAGSPLSGQGVTFAKAAWDYGVDPRWSPAIAFTESSLGANCFNPHNAWGWGSASWGSWEEAIPEHVAGLARGYGYTISIEAAQKYCPPNWEAWYNRTLEQMNAI